MKWIVENWSLLVVIACVAASCIVYVRKFANKPTDEQIAKVKEWLLYAVIMAERDFGGGTGALKLRSVYNDFCEVFPALVDVVSFTMFSALVDEALEQMKHLLETNKDIEAYVED